jgi:hypothetical protein
LASALLLAFVAAGVAVRLRGVEDRKSAIAEGLVEQVLKASTSQVPGIVDSMAEYRRWTDPALRTAFEKSPQDSSQELHASLALLPVDASQVKYLQDRLLASSPVELPVIWGLLRKHEPGANKRLRSLLEDPKADPEERFRAACAVANPDEALVEKQWDAVTPFVTDRFLTAVIKNPGDYTPLIETLRPIRKRLVPPLTTIFRDPGRSESERIFATTLLADYAGDDPDFLANLLMDAEPKAYATLFPVAERQGLKTIEAFRAEIKRA